jgi:serine phosphatase RsbU (regulator of sigma subunit)
MDTSTIKPRALSKRRSPAGGTEARSTRLATWSRLAVTTKQSAMFGTGGDFFEVFQHRDGRVSAVMADVCGRGPSAAVVVAAVRPLLRRCLARGDAPGRVLTVLNEWISRHVRDSFVTALAVRIDVGDGRTEIASAGHLGPFVRRRSGAAHALTMAGSVPLGMLAGQRYGEMVLRLQPDDALVLATDGITDPLATHTDLLGERGLLRRLARAPHDGPDICQALLADDAPVRDDATVVVLQLPQMALAQAA